MNIENIKINRLTTICFDFGNTLKKVAIFKENELILVQNIVIEDEKSIIDVLIKFSPAKSILSSVVDHNPGIENIISSKTSFKKLSANTSLPFTTPVSKPETIGSDRLALAAAAVTLFAGKNNLIVALGSCITYNFINYKNEFLGGSISPGLEMRLRSLHTFTAKLPLIEPEWQFPLIGFDTKTNILSGVIFGITKEIEGIIDEYERRFNNFNVVLTGGDSPYFAQHLKNKIFADPQLIFKGLYAISEYDTKT